MNTIAVQNAIVVARNVINLRKNRKRLQEDRRLKTLKLCELLAAKPPKRLPRVWMFERTSTFFEDSASFPDDVFTKKFRMSKSLFMKIFSDLEPNLSKQYAVRSPIPAIKRFSIGIFVLKSGSDYGVVADLYGISPTSVFRITEDLIDAIIAVYLNSEIVFPSTPDLQKAEANKFWGMHQFVNCIAAIDGCHIPIKTPVQNGADYYNYKHFHSTVLQAAVNSEYL
jgi:hypothetical protein